MTRIYLDRSRSPRAFGGAESLWAEDLFRVLRLIGQHVQQLDGSTEEGDCRGKPGTNPRQSNVHSEEDEPFLSIAIFGPSGSGKSSLLSTLVREVQLSRQATGGFFHDHGVLSHLDSGDPFYGQRDTVKDLHCKMATLKVLHPDTFAQDDNFLYAVLARALEEEKRVNDKKRATAEPDVLSALQRRFQELSDFLRVLDPVERSQDYDPLGLSLERMERHTSGLLLRDKLKDFLGQLPNSLGVSKGGIVLLPVDDVDMSPEHMVEILQIYQSFLLHPRVVPVFTFTDRTAEELLNVHFSKYLSHNSQTFDEPGEGGNRLRVSEKLALQHLARCFPVRNRIRLGPAPARVQKANYLRSFCEVSKSNSDGTPVLDLLRAANFLLFGHPDWDKTHEVRAALRPSTLRRQLHVMDTLVEAEITPYITTPFERVAFPKSKRKGSDAGTEKNRDEEQPAEPTEKDHWARLLNRSTWAILNVHRDVLREFDLYLEDLYSWSARALRRVVLETLLCQDMDVRRALLRRWRDRADSRRSQVLSLLAMSIFKPWTPVEEPYGDDEYLYSGVATENAAATSNAEGKRGLCADTVFLWFLELTVGFYMPMALARPRKTETISAGVGSRVIGIGWDIESGPVNAVRDADARQNMMPTGICFMDNNDFQQRLNPGIAFYKEKNFTLPEANEPTCLYEHGIKEETDKRQRYRNELMARLWCFYGFGQGRYWSAVSFWRGLGLLARITDQYRRHRYQHGNQKGFQDRLRVLVRHHILRGLVPVGMLGKIVDEEQMKSVAFKRWDRWEKSEETKDAIGAFVEEIEGWLSPSGSDKTGEPFDDDQNGILEFMPDNDGEISWHGCIMRRLHGEDILGDFHLRLATVYIEEKDQYFHQESDGFRLTAGAAVLSWVGTLLEYWRGVYPMQRLLRSCPLLRPFVKSPVAVVIRKHLLNREYEELRYWVSQNGLSDMKFESFKKNQLKNMRWREALKGTGWVKSMSKVLGSSHRVKESEVIVWDEFCKGWSLVLVSLLTKFLWFGWGIKVDIKASDLREDLGRHYRRDLGIKVDDGEICVHDARTLVDHQLQEVFWVSREILVLRWLWGIRRADWTKYQARDDGWMQSRVMEMTESQLEIAERQAESAEHQARAVEGVARATGQLARTSKQLAEAAKKIKS